MVVVARVAVVVVAAMVVFVSAGRGVEVLEVSEVGEDVSAGGGAVVVVVITTSVVDGIAEVALKAVEALPDDDSGSDPQLTSTGRQKQNSTADRRRRQLKCLERAGRRDATGIGTGFYHITPTCPFRRWRGFLGLGARSV